MRSANNIAMKEWAVVTAAIAAGRQTILLRKGGIDEEGGGFHVQHDEFWLLPTRFHQEPGAVVDQAQRLWNDALAQQSAPGKFRVEIYAAVQAIFQIRELSQLERLAGQHILSAETVWQRFYYREPGLFVLAIRAYRVPQAFEVEDSPYLSGCKSWVELAESIPTAGMKPVLDDPTFAGQLEKIATSANG